jgi:adenosylcobinamide hydrolase
MKYFLRGSTLFLRGSFRAASTGIDGGLRDVSTILNHTVPKGFDHHAPLRILSRCVEEEGFPPGFFGMLTAVEMASLCILHYDFLSVFITAGVDNPDPAGPGTINIIVHSAEGISDGGMLETVITATEAKAEALRELGHEFYGTTTDAVIVAHEGGAIAHRYAGSLTELGRRVHATVLFGVQEALKRHEGAVHRSLPSLFVFSRYGGDRWFEWQPEGCPYYPCHFEGQRCDFCYCPFYPCGDGELGALVQSSSGGEVWSCQHCTLLHDPGVAHYLKRHPEAGINELKRVKNKGID